MNLDKWMLILLTDTKRMGTCIRFREKPILCIGFREKVGFENNEYGVLLELQVAASVQWQEIWTWV